MSWSLGRITGTGVSPSPRLNCRRYSPKWSASKVFLGYCFQTGTRISVLQHLRLRRFCSGTGDGEVFDVSDGPNKSFADPEGPKQKEESQTPKSFTSSKLMEKLKRYGVSGVLSYGLLNTAYYLTTFLVVWFYVVPAPGKLGYAAAVERFFKVLAMVWAGSQVTKLVRAGGALALAPIVDRGLSWFTSRFKFKSPGKAFMAIAGLCFGLAFLVFLTVTLLST